MLQFIPGRSDNLALATGVFGNQLYWVDPDNNIAGVAYQFPTDKVWEGQSRASMDWCVCVTKGAETPADTPCT